ncbi:hypothetical protein GJ496_011850 [Pomphorhynchus laevis]|nr:hypothetical protein GJ496_011850 [Pomphorhynchus laevis]
MDNDDDDLLNSAEKIEQIYNDNNFEISFAADDTFTRTQPFIPEFDVETGQSWHYPIDLPQRQYQYNIVQKSLYKNTLVVLPTGLGKTFISSVVMYNFHRWYPQSIVLFLAPTKPLVSQQTLAFRQVTNLPSDVIVEMTGILQLFTY